MNNRGRIEVGRMTAMQNITNGSAVPVVFPVKSLDSYIVGLVVEDSQEAGKIRVKLLGLPGSCGPELNMDRSLAEDLHRTLGQYLETGQRQEK